MELFIRNFNALSAGELYDLLQARAAVFVVEQTCPYQDLDGMDQESTHVYYREDGKIAAYLRVFRLDATTAKIGRVLTVRRGQGLGLPLLQAGIDVARSMAGIKAIYIEAQSYAVGFYEKAGFKVVGEEFLEDGIPHIGMRLEL